jgi:hypothetical protein
MSIPRISFDFGIKISQGRITVDRERQYKFALAVENFVTGGVSTASRELGSSVTTFAEVGPREPAKEGDALRS